MEWLNDIYKIRRITGPTSLRLLKLNGKLIFIFGDYHRPTPQQSITKTSSSIMDYFDIIFTSHGICCDLYLETSGFTHVYNFDELRNNQQNIPIHKSPPHQQTDLNNVVDKYWDCLGPLKDNCPSHVRLHNIEFRRSLETTDDLNYSLMHIYDGFGRGLSDLIRILRISNTRLGDELYMFRNILDAMIDGDLVRVSNIYLELFRNFVVIREKYTYDNIVRYSGFQKMHQQYKNLPPYIINRIKNELLKDIDKVISVQPRLSNNIFKMGYRLVVDVAPGADRIVAGSDDDGSEGSVLLLREQILNIATIFNDAYTIGRMLKNIYSYSDSTALFLYAGEEHAKRVYDIYCKIYECHKQYMYGGFMKDHKGDDDHEYHHEICIEKLIDIENTNFVDSYVDLNLRQRKIIRGQLLGISQFDNHSACSYKS